MKQCDVCVLFLIGLVGLLCIPIQEPIDPIIINEDIEEIVEENIESNETNIGEDMVKIIDAVDQNITLDIVKMGLRNIWFTGTYWYFADMDNYTIKVFRYNSDFSNKTQVYSRDVNVNTRVYYSNLVLKVFSGTIYVGLCAGNQNKSVELSITRSSDGVNWTDAIFYTPTTSDVWTNMKIDLFEITSGGDPHTYIVMAYQDRETSYQYPFFNWLNTATNGLNNSFGGVTTYPNCNVVWGYVENNAYYFLVYDTAGSTYHIYSLTLNYGASLSGTFAIYSSPTLSGGGDIDAIQSILYKQNNAIVLGWKDHCFYFDNATWLSVTVPTSTYPVPHWYLDSSVLKIKYFTYSNTYLSFNENNRVLVSKYSTTYSCYAAWDSYFITTDLDVFKLELTSLTNLSTCTVAVNTYKPPDAKLISTQEPIDNQYLKLYTDADVEFYEGYVESYESKQQGIYVYTMRSPIEQDFQKKITVSFVGQTSHYILKYILDNYCDFLWYASGISTTPATTYTVSFNNKTIVEIIKWLDQQENYQTSIRPSLEVYRDTYTSSTLTWTENTDFPVSEFTWVKRPLKLSIVKINYTGGSVTVYGEANYGYLEDTMSHITDLTTATATANSILTNKNVTLIKLHFDIQGKGQLNYGQTVQITSGTYSIDDDTYYIIGTLYDALQDICEMELTSAIYIPSTKTNVITGSPNALQNQVNDVEHQVDDLYQHIGQVNKSVTTGFKTDAQGDFKGNYALRWGTSGTPTGITPHASIDTNEIVSSYLSHTYPVHLIGDSAETITFTVSSLSDGWYSMWTLLKQTNKEHYGLWIRNGGSMGGCWYFGSDGNLKTFDKDSNLTTIQSYVADVWYHLAIHFVQNTSIEYYLNGVLVKSYTAAGNFVIDTAFIYPSAADLEWYIDSWYSGTSLDEAMNSLHDGQIQAKGFYDLTTQQPLEVRYLQANAGTTIKGDLLPDGNKTRDLGSASIAFDDIYADDFQNVASETKSRYIEPKIALDGICAIKKENNSLQPDYATMPFCKPFVIPKTIIMDKKETIVNEIHHTRSLVGNLDYLNSSTQQLEAHIRALEAQVKDLQEAILILQQKVT